MTKIFIHLCIAFFLSMIELSFIASFHGMIRFVPLVFVLSVYVIQHHSVFQAVLWMVLHGLMLDSSGLSVYPYATVAFILAGAVAVYSANHLFSNRSFYGVLACALLSYTSYLFVEGVFLLFFHVTSRTIWPFSVFFSDAIHSYLMLVVSLYAFFLFAKQIRFWLENIFLIPKSRQTF